MIALLLLVAAAPLPECVLQPGSPPRILLVGGADPASALQHRLVAEMGSAGILAEVVEPGGGGDLADLARQRGAFATLRIQVQDGRTRIQIVYARPGPSAPRREGLAAADDDTLAFAWRVLDVLNARLLAARLVCRRVEQAQAPEPAPAPAAPPPEPEAARQPIRLAVEAGPAMFLPLDPEPTLALGLAVAIYPRPALRLELDSAVSLFPSVLNEAQGSAEIGYLRAQFGVAYEPGWWAWGRPFAGLASGVLAIWADGQAGSGYAARFDATAVWHVGLTAGLVFSLTDAFELRLALAVSLPYHEIGIRMGDRTVARVGRPWMDVGLRLAWRPF